MESGSPNSFPEHSSKATDVTPAISTPEKQDNSAKNTPLQMSTSRLSSWKNFKLPDSLVPSQQDSQSGSTTIFAFSRIASGLSLQFPSRASSTNDSSTGGSSETTQSGVFESITKGLVDSSMSAVKAVQTKARHIVSQNKRRYQDGGFDLDMTYITENIIAMGFPAGDMSSGLFGYFEGFYRNHMEEVIKFFETHHKGKYKVYNLCSERLYDASLFEGKVASLPFDDHNCPPIHLIKLFCQSAYSWLKEDIINVVVVHCKAGMARTGLMICSLLLYLEFFSTAEECMGYYNQKRCVDGKALILPSQIRYVRYFECILKQFNGETPPGRRCMLRGFKLHKCPYWIRPSITILNHNGVLFMTKKHPKTKDLKPEDFWIRAPRKGIVVFALPGEPGLTKLSGDFKIHFHDPQGDFYCWLNTTMMENRVILSSNDLDGFDKRKLPSPGFQVEIVTVDYDGTTLLTKFKSNNSSNKSRVIGKSSSSNDATKINFPQIKGSRNQNNDDDDDDVFSDSGGEETASSRTPMANTSNATENYVPSAASNNLGEQTPTLTRDVEQLSIVSKESSHLQTETHRDIKMDEMERPPSIPHLAPGDIKAIAADASVFSFGDDEDYESE